MSKLLKARMRWGIALLAGLTVSLFTADDQCDIIRMSSPGLTKKLLLNAEALASPFFYFFTNEQEPSKRTETENSQRKTTSEKVEPIDQEQKINIIYTQSKDDLTTAIQAAVFPNQSKAKMFTDSSEVVAKL